MHEVLVNRLGGLSLPRKSVVTLTDRPDMTLDVYRGRKTTIQQKKNSLLIHSFSLVNAKLLKAFGTAFYAITTIKRYSAKNKNKKKKDDKISVCRFSKNVSSMLNHGNQK